MSGMHIIFSFHTMINASIFKLLRRLDFSQKVLLKKGNSSLQKQEIGYNMPARR